MPCMVPLRKTNARLIRFGFGLVEKPVTSQLALMPRPKLLSSPLSVPRSRIEPPLWRKACVLPSASVPD